jgi:hypothetical protein
LAGGTDVVVRESRVVAFRRLTLRSATGTAQRAVPTLRAFDTGDFFGCELRMDMAGG